MIFAPKDQPVQSTLIPRHILPWHNYFGASINHVDIRGGMRLAHQMTTLLHKLYLVKLSTNGQGEGVKYQKDCPRDLWMVPFIRRLVSDISTSCTPTFGCSIRSPSKFLDIDQIIYILLKNHHMKNYLNIRTKICQHN